MGEIKVFVTTKDGSINGYAKKRDHDLEISGTKDKEVITMSIYCSCGFATYYSNGKGQDFLSCERTEMTCDEEHADMLSAILSMANRVSAGCPSQRVAIHRAIKPFYTKRVSAED